MSCVEVAEDTTLEGEAILTVEALDEDVPDGADVGVTVTFWAVILFVAAGCDEVTVAVAGVVAETATTGDAAEPATTAVLVVACDATATDGGVVVTGTT
jgi:hypothetical protein